MIPLLTLLELVPSSFIKKAIIYSYSANRYIGRDGGLSYIKFFNFVTVITVSYSSFASHESNAQAVLAELAARAVVG